ncbi:hypothetical protein l13_08240 [Neisseria weaveri ATCC 51223]|nr:hypothetical protein l13_08240 [Neisseria weaveri ATCC 51223]
MLCKTAKGLSVRFNINVVKKGRLKFQTAFFYNLYINT